jgi:hypothetical protein
LPELLDELLLLTQLAAALSSALHALEMASVSVTSCAVHVCLAK